MVAVHRTFGPGSDRIRRSHLEAQRVEEARNNGLVVTDAGQVGGYVSGNTIGVYARGIGDLTPDIILGADNSSTLGDNGIIASSSFYQSSDIFLQSNDGVVVQLDHDGGGEDADFEVRNAQGTLIFNVDESGNASLAGTLTEGSDRNSKQGLAPVDNTSVLA